MLNVVPVIGLFRIGPGVCCLPIRRFWKLACRVLSMPHVYPNIPHFRLHPRNYIKCCNHALCDSPQSFSAGAWYTPNGAHDTSQTLSLWEVKTKRTLLLGKSRWYIEGPRQIIEPGTIIERHATV